MFLMYVESWTNFTKKDHSHMLLQIVLACYAVNLLSLTLLVDVVLSSVWPSINLVARSQVFMPVIKQIGCCNLAVASVSECAHAFVVVVMSETWLFFQDYCK